MEEIKKKQGLSISEVKEILEKEDPESMDKHMHIPHTF